MRRIALIVLILISSSALAQNSSALISEALDKIYPLDLHTTLPVAMKAIGEQSGVRVEAAPNVWEALPWGDQTTLTAKIEGKTLRDALDAIARKLGLIVVPRDEAVELRPMPALSRLGRRSTVQELAALDLLASTPANLNTDKPTVKQLLDAVDQKLVDLKSPYSIENRASDAARPEQQVFVPRNSSLMQALESLVAETRATWYPWDKSLVIVPKEMQIKSLLDKTITIRYNGVDVAQVLAELSQRSGVEFSIEPGAIQRVAPEFRTIRLVLSNATVRQALENLAGFTGLGYVVNENGVYIWNQLTNPTGGARDPVVGMVQLENGMQLLITKSQMPQDVQQYLNTKTQKEIDKIRLMMKQDGFVPTTKPSTMPVREDL
ncbi:MAG TPA: hypothetical protein VHD56_16815 [Tepidisphaeraceae bacterium]|nr:hypothetical protein [Tepidisphaeraceae bacterium]